MNISHLASEIIRTAGNKLDLRIVVELANGEKGYMESTKAQFDYIKPDVIVTVFFPSNINKKTKTFFPKKFIKEKLKYLEDYDRQKFMDEDVNKRFKHPKIEKRFINDVLDFIGDEKKPMMDILRFLMTRGLRFHSTSHEALKEAFTEAGFVVDEGYANNVSKGNLKRQVGFAQHSY